MTTLSKAADWMFRDRTTGQVVVAQFPNIPILVWLGATVAGLFTSGTTHTVIGWIGTGGLVWWAGDELLRGVNPFRRILGAVVLIWTAVGLVRS
jgi:hypothetical protein